MNGFTKKLQIGLIGFAGKEEYPSLKDRSVLNLACEYAEKIGMLITQHEAILVTGGKGGVMESAARGAKRAGGLTVGIIKGKQRGSSNKYIDIEFLTGMEASGLDELFLVLMSDVLIVLGGGAGTLQEIVVAYRNRKPIIYVSGTKGYGEKFIDKYLDERKLVNLIEAHSPERAVELAIREGRKHSNRR